MRELASIMKLDDAEWFTEDEFAKATRAGRSTCVVPAYERMSSLEIENMMPFERVIYVTLLAQFIEQENEKIKQKQASKRN